MALTRLPIAHAPKWLALQSPYNLEVFYGHPGRANAIARRAVQFAALPIACAAYYLALKSEAAVFSGAPGMAVWWLVQAAALGLAVAALCRHSPSVHVIDLLRLYVVMTVGLILVGLSILLAGFVVADAPIFLQKFAGDFGGLMLPVVFCPVVAAAILGCYHRGTSLLHRAMGYLQLSREATNLASTILYVLFWFGVPLWWFSLAGPIMRPLGLRLFSLPALQEIVLLFVGGSLFLQPPILIYVVFDHWVNNVRRPRGGGDG